MRQKFHLSSHLQALRHLPTTRWPLSRTDGVENLDSLGPVLGRVGSLEVRLVRTKSELKAAQRLRYHVFYKEMSARNSVASLTWRRDVDPFDAHCDHLIVLDTEAKRNGKRGEPEKIVGTYRLLRQSVAERHAGFYTQGEYDIAPLIARHPEKRFLELGRSCVLKEYRTKRTVELLWHGIWAYVLHHRIDVMFGCASLEGTDEHELRDQLSLLAAASVAPEEWRVRAHAHQCLPMVATAGDTLPNRKVFSALPPLIKGYLRIGAYIGEGAVVDHAFGTTDVLIVLPVERINPRYVAHYGESAGRYAA